MRRAQLIAAMGSISSSTLFNSFWILVPAVLRNRYRYSCFTWASPAEVLEQLEKLTPSELMDTMVLVELPSEMGNSPWHVERLGRDDCGFAASLVLAFPEVYFVFLGKMPAEGADPAIEVCRQYIEPIHFVTWPSILWFVELVSHHSRSFRTLFDTSGFRTYLKLKLLRVQAEEERGLLYEPHIRARLSQHAVAADEEEAYTYLHGYSLYRMGYLTSLLGTEKEFRDHLEPIVEQIDHLKQSADESGGPHGTTATEGARANDEPYSASPNFIITDWELLYPDHESSSAGQRTLEPDESKLLNDLLDKVNLPTLVVSGHTSEPELIAFVDGAKSHRSALPKPHGGVYQIEECVKCLICKPIQQNILQNILQAVLALKERVKRLMRKPIRQKTDKLHSSGFRHSLPFARSVVVNYLVDRAASLRSDDPAGVRQNILQSVLALEARELLGDLSRTTRYEASFLQIEGELSAELSWFGISSEAEVTGRIRAMKQESKADIKRHQSLAKGERKLAKGAGMASPPSLRKADRGHSLRDQEVNYLYRAFDLMRDIYNQHGQIAAGDSCHREVIEAHREISRRTALHSRLFAWYLHAATADGTRARRILLASLIVIGLSTICYGVLLENMPGAHMGLGRAATLATGNGIFSFVGLQPGLDEYKQAVKDANPGDIWRIFNFTVALVEMLFAYLNLGLLLSVIYRKLTRASL